MSRATSTRRKQINVCVTQQEYERILAAANGSSLSMSSYVRRKALRGASADARQGATATVSAEQTEASHETL